jgi:hypothetical protein
MFNEEIKPKVELKEIEIVPLKDHVIKQNNFYYELKKGEKIKVDKKFLATLLIEKIITKG